MGNKITSKNEKAAKVMCKKILTDEASPNRRITES